MHESYSQSRVIRQGLRGGPGGAYIDGFVGWLHGRGYKPSYIYLTLWSLARSAEWVRRVHFGNSFVGTVAEEGAAALAGEKRHRRRSDPTGHSRTAVALYIRYLREQGVIPRPAVSPSAIQRWPLLREFRSWMVQHRGLRESTLDVYQRVVAGLFAALGDDPRAYTAAQLRDFVLQHAKPRGRACAQDLTTSVRAFLRFCGATGRCSAGLDHGIPQYASWAQASVPRYLEAADVQRVLDACLAKDTNSLRDHAVMLLLARLGLRAGDVAGLTFRDLDWKNARIALCGKGRRQEWLPLPQDVGDALLRYLQNGRPRFEADCFFTTVHAPTGPLTSGLVTGIARRALRRAGIRASSNGAHIFRHSAATAMLRQGASLAGVGSVLRHRSPTSTAHYAKVDFNMLSEIAQPWPEVSPC